MTHPNEGGHHKVSPDGKEESGSNYSVRVQDANTGKEMTTYTKRNCCILERKYTGNIENLQDIMPDDEK